MATVSSTFLLDGQASATFALAPRQTATFSVTLTGSSAFVVRLLEKNGSAWNIVSLHRANVSAAIIENPSPNVRYLSVDAQSVGANNSIAVELADVSGDNLTEWKNGDGTTVFAISETGIESPAATITTTTGNLTGNVTGNIAGGTVAGTSVTYSTLASSVTALATPSALAATALNAFASTVSGATLMGFGTTGDVTLKNRAGTDVVVVTSNTTGVTMAGALAMTGALSGVTTAAISTSATVTSASAVALAVGLAGATNPAFVVDSSTATQAAGFKVTGAVAAGTVAAAVISSGADASLTINAKGTGTIGIGSASTGAVTITPATTVTGALTATGGVVLASTPTIAPAAGGMWQLATAGTDVACTDGTSYFVELNIAHNRTATGLAYQVGSVGGTNSVIAVLYDSTGAVVANSALAGAVVGTAAQIQSVVFLTPYAAKSGRYFASVTFNGTTAKFRAYPIPGSVFIAGSEAETFGTVTAITPGTTFTADKGPLCYVY